MTPSGSTQVTINRLAPGTTYEFQVIGKNALGDGMMSKVITVRTLGKYYFSHANFYLHTKYVFIYCCHKKMWDCHRNPIVTQRLRLLNRLQIVPVRTVACGAFPRPHIFQYI